MAYRKLDPTDAYAWPMLQDCVGASELSEDTHLRPDILSLRFLAVKATPPNSNMAALRASTSGCDVDKPS